jgi:hypothetical protein
MRPTRPRRVPRSQVLAETFEEATMDDAKTKPQIWGYHPTKGAQLFDGDTLPEGWSDKPFTGQHPEQGGTVPATGAGAQAQANEREALQAKVAELEAANRALQETNQEQAADLEEAEKTFAALKQRIAELQAEIDRSRAPVAVEPPAASEPAATPAGAQQGRKGKAA